MVNEVPGDKVAVPCSCKGRNSECMNCHGTGTRWYKACRRCGGVGKEPGGKTCLDCRGEGWRDVDAL